VKSLEETAQAPINAKNAFAMLPPAPATQKEVGFRAVGSNGFSATLAYFTVNRANTTIDPVTNIYGLNGTNTFSGVETTLNARIAPRLSLAFGGQLENATEHSPDDPTIDGKIPENTPKLSGSLGLTYQAPFAPGLQLTGGVQYVGLRQINPQDQGTIPAVTLANVGLAYTKTNNGRRVTFNLNCKNCTDKRYWSSAVNSALGVGAPRTLSFSVRFAGLP
jgi:iron complex outermembrane receptor protein